MSDPAPTEEPTGAPDEEPTGTPDEPAAPSRHRGRGATSVVLAVVAGILLPLAGITVWTRNQLLDTDRYVSTVAPLATDPAVQSAASARLTSVVQDAVDFQAVAQDALPDRAKVLAGPIAAGAEQLVGQIADKLVHSQQFQTVWDQANRTGHEAVVAALTGEGTPSVDTADGKVVLQLGPLAEKVIKGIDDRTGLDLAGRIPADKLKASFVLVQSKDLARIQSLVKWLNRLTWFLVLAALACLLGAVFVAVDRRKGVRRAGWAVTISSAVALAAFAVVRNQYLSSLPQTVSQSAASASYDILVRNLRLGFRVLGVIGLVLLIGSLVRLPAPGAEPGPVPRWVAAHVTALRAGVLVVAAGALLLLDQPAVGSVVGIIVAAAVLIGAIQAMAGRGVPAPEA